MVRRQLAVAVILCSLLVPTVALAQQAQPAAAGQAQGGQTRAKDPNDPIEKIKDEGFNRSEIMQTLSYLTDVIGPRLTGSPNMRRANDWTKDTLASWGLQNAHLEAWGPFGRGWSLKTFSAEVVDPQTIPLIAYPKAWSPGTNGAVTGDVVYLDAKDAAGLEKYKGKLKGAIVFTADTRELKANFKPLGARLDEKELLALADAPDPAGTPRRAFQLTDEQRAALKFNSLKLQFAMDEGAAVLVDPSRGGDGGTLFVQSATVPQPNLENPFDARRVQPFDKAAPQLVPQIVVAGEHYNRIMRMLQQGQKVKMTVNLGVQFHDTDLMAYNTIAEIPGTDLKDEIVMLGGHMDSWHSGTGATDNGAGVAVAMEAVRILQKAGLKPRRTVRIALWSGEEQGLLGSRAYVKEHFGTMGDGSAATAMSALIDGKVPTVTPKPDYEKFSAYFNLDNGTGKVRGVYMQGNEAVRPLFRKWLTPFGEMGASTLSASNTGGTDHLSFDAIGLPGFQFIQDEIEYDTRTHHSNQDVYDRIQADDMKQAAVIMAAFVYNAATMDQKLPRKPMPQRTAATAATR